MAQLGDLIVNGKGKMLSTLTVNGAVTAPSFTGVASQATNDSSNQKITSTYIKGLSVNGRTVTYTKGDGTTGTITTQDTNTTYSTGTTSTAGLTKLYAGTGTATDGTMTQNAIKTALDGKSGTGHTHSQYYDSQISRTANTVLAAPNGSDGGATFRKLVAADIPSHGTHIPSTCKTIDDWNNATTNGWYMSSTATNAPTSGTWYYGIVIAHNTSYLRQILFHFSSSNNVTSETRYERIKQNGTWGSWTNTTVGTPVPTGAKFTDTNTWRGIQNNLTSDSTSDSLAAAQGKALKALIDGKANSSHTHDLSTMINTLTTGTSVPTDNDYYVAQYVGGGTTTTTYHRRPVSALWSYIKTKTDATYLPLSGGTLTGNLTINSGKLLSLSNSSRLMITKDSNNTPATAYGDFKEAFYTAYTEKNFALIMATPAVFADGTINGVFGIHQRNGGLYVGYLKYKGAEADRKWFKLIDSNGDSSFMPKYNIKTLTTQGCTGWSNNATDDKIIPTMSFMAYWDGSYSTGHASNLAYCNKGAFGTVVTRNLAGNNNYKASDFSDLGEQSTVPSIQTLAYWNGGYGHNDSKTWYYSNLAWCNKGAFANGAVTSITYGTAAPSGSASKGDIYIQIS